MSEPTTVIKDKSITLFRLGFLREQDRHDVARIESRWQLYQTVPQQTARSGKQRVEKGEETR